MSERKAPAPKAASNRRMTAIRIPEDDLEEIRRRASEAQLTLTEYMIRAALGELVDRSIGKRVKELERRMQRLENKLD